MDEHHWADEIATDHGLLRETHCTDTGCYAVRIRVGDQGGLHCSWHGRQMSSPCYSCESVPWRRGMVWADHPDIKVGRCEYVDENAYGDAIRCCLIRHHTIGHQFTCRSTLPGTMTACWLPYGHRGDNHADRDGIYTWVDPWIGPVSRKPDSEWAVLS